MKLRILTILFIALLVLALKFQNKVIFEKVLTNDTYTYIAVNQIMMWIANNGDGSHDPRNDGNGFYWPNGENGITSAIFEDGLIWGGKVSETGVDTLDIRVNGNTHRKGLQAGRILENGQADDPSDPRYRVYKIHKNWQLFPPGDVRDAFENDYNEWPAKDGAPWIDMNGDNVYTAGVDQPNFIGDEVLWYVSNDMDSSRTEFTYGSDPLGLEQQCTVFGFNRTGDLGDVVFKKYKMVNKGPFDIDSMYFTYWSDPDLGGAGDDFVGCDTTLNLAYCYNSDDDDVIYNPPVPAVGYVLLQGPIISGKAEDKAFAFGNNYPGMKNLPMTSFILYINANPQYSDPSQGTIEGSVYFYHYMSGFNRNGGPINDPHSGKQTKFMVSGDPLAGTGWYEGSGFPGGPAPGDRRMVMSSGPFTFAQQDSQEFVIAILIARGSNYLDSVAKLKEKAIVVRDFYYSDVVNSLNIDGNYFPDNIVLKQNYPNPFNPETRISYQLMINSKVKLTVYDLLGREVQLLVDKYQTKGKYSVTFDAQNLASGIYFYRLKTANHILQRKMLLIK